MLMNFKDGHSPNTKGNYLCKCRVKKGKKNKTWYEVLQYNEKEKIYFRPFTPKFDFNNFFVVISWVRIREK